MRMMSNCDERVGCSFLLGSEAKHDGLLGPTDVGYILYAQAVRILLGFIFLRQGLSFDSQYLGLACLHEWFCLLKQGQGQDMKSKCQLQSASDGTLCFMVHGNGICGIMYDS
jgi:hypothetical protein